MNTLSEYNNFSTLGPPMRFCFFFILLSILSLSSFSQNYDTRSSSLANCGLTETSVWSNFTNQAGIADIKQFTREILKSGWDEIEGNKITEIKVQLRYKF